MNPTTRKHDDEYDLEKAISHAEYVADPFGKFLDAISNRHTKGCRSRTGHSCNCWKHRVFGIEEPKS